MQNPCILRSVLEEWATIVKRHAGSYYYLAFSIHASEMHTEALTTKHSRYLEGGKRALYKNQHHGIGSKPQVSHLGSSKE